MPTPQGFEDRLHRVLVELGLASKRMAQRCRSMLHLVEENDRRGGLGAIVEDGVKHLEKVHALFVDAGGGGRTLSLDDVRSTEPHHPTVSRCVKGMLDTLDGRGNSRATKPLNKFQVPELRGSSHILDVTQLLDTFAQARATGTLEVATVEESFTLVLEEGRVDFAASDQSPPGSRLGDILVAQGALGKSALEGLLQETSTSERRFLGDVIRESGQVTEQQLREALEEQMRRLFQRLLGCAESSFVFRLGRQVGATVRANLSVQSLLLEGARRMDEEAA